MFYFFFSSRRRHTRYWRDWSSDVCSSDLTAYQDNKQNSSKCPKCLSGDMVEHPSFLSMPFTSPSKIAAKSRTAIEDQDADFVFRLDRKSTRLNSSHANISYAVFCLPKITKPSLRKFEN